MISAGAAMTGTYDPLQVALSVLIAVSASYAALDLAEPVTAASGNTRLTWLIGGSTRDGDRHGGRTTSGCWLSTSRGNRKAVNLQPTTGLCRDIP